MYANARSYVHIGEGYSEEFEVKVGVHQGLVPSPLLFIIVLEALSCEFCSGVPWKDLHANDLIIIAELLEEYVRRLLTWKALLWTVPNRSLGFLSCTGNIQVYLWVSLNLKCSKHLYWDSILTFTILWPNSEDGKLISCHFPQKKRLLHFYVMLSRVTPFQIYLPWTVPDRSRGILSCNGPQKDLFPGLFSTIIKWKIGCYKNKWNFQPYELYYYTAFTAYFKTF